MLQLRNVSKVYNSGKNRVQALKNLNIDFPDKGLIFVVGKSGSGKSTLLNLLGGLDSMTTGEIIIDGFSTHRFSSADFNSFRNFYVGFIFQEFNLIEEMNVYENIATVLKIQAKAHSNHAIDDVLKMVGLEGLGYRKPNELSGGQRQRISIARALVKNPRIILADEPTGALDSKTGHDLIASLKNLAQDKLVIIVSHDRELAYEYGDQIMELKDGEIIEKLVIKDKDQNIVQLEDGVIRIPANTIISDPQVINEKLKPAQTNYVCINTDAERVSLAYANTFEYLYNRKAIDEKYIPDETPLHDIAYKKSHFQRARIHVKELISMARSSLKRKRRRLTASIIFISLAMMFLSAALIIGQVNVISISQLIIQDSISTVTRFSRGYSYYGNYAISSYNNNFIGDADYAVIDDMGVNYAKTFNITLNYLSGEGKGTSIDCLAETKNLPGMNFTYLAGNSNLNIDDIPTVVISDYIADQIKINGYIGYNQNNEFKLMYPESYADFIGSQIILQNNQMKEYLVVKVGGIIASNYQNASSYDAKTPYYCYMFVAQGFKEKFIPLQILDATLNANNKSRYAYSFTLHFALDDIKTKKVLAGTIPQKLGENEIVISSAMAQQLLAYETSQSNYDNLIDNTKYSLYLYIGSYNNQSWFENLTIKAVYEEAADYCAYLSEEVHQDLLTYANKTDSIYINAKSINNLSFVLQKLIDINIHLVYGYYSTESIGYMVESITSVFFVVALIFGIIGFLFIFSFISSSIKSRKKEIGILRASGARSSDVFNIFFTEILMMSILILMVTGPLTSFIVWTIDSSIASFLSIRFMEYTIVDYFLTGILILAFMTIAAAIPILGIVRQRPVDSIKRE